MKHIAPLWLSTVCAAALCFALLGCGVETGPGVNGVVLLFEGVFVDSQGAPVSGVDVTLLESGDSCRSDAGGLCRIESGTLSGSATLEIDSDNGQSIRAQIFEIPSDATKVTYTVTQSAAGFLLAVTGIESGGGEPPAEEPTPAPGETPLPGDTPAPGETPIPGKTPTPNPAQQKIDRGKKVFNGICANCHRRGQGDGYSASQLNAALGLSQHQNVHLSQNQFNDLLAYLNR